MATLAVLFFVVAGVTAVALVISNLSEVAASKLATAALRPELNAAVLNVDTSQARALCDRHLDSPMSRIVKDVLAKADRVRASGAIRSEVFRMLLDHALAREVERAGRATNALRTIAFICPLVGLMATVWDCSPGWFEADPPYPIMAQAVSYTIAGLILSLAVFSLSKYLSARFAAELSKLDEACSDFLAAFLAHPARSTVASGTNRP